MALWGRYIAHTTAGNQTFGGSGRVSGTRGVWCGANAGSRAPSEIPPASKADGRILFAKVQTLDNGGKDDGIYLLENAGKPRQLLAKAEGDYALQYPRWSPDGGQIAYVRAGDRGIFSDLWIMRENVANNRQITKFKSAIAAHE